MAAAALLTSFACGGSSPHGPSGARAPVTFTVMTFNIQHGIDLNGRYNLQNAVGVIARVQPDIVGLQEVTRNHPSYACDDQPARIADALQSATATRWAVDYEQEWFTPDVSCQQSGRGDGRETEGLVLLTKRTMAQPKMLPLVDSRIGMETTLADAYNVPIAVTHLTSGAAGSGMRAQQAAQLAAWLNGFGDPRIVIGDFNAAPGAPELQPVAASYHDAWQDGAAAGRASGNANSHGTARIDYIFFRPGSSLTLDSVSVIDTAPIVGVQASDHSPVLATFTIR